MGKIKYKVPATSFKETDLVKLFANQLNTGINKNTSFYDSFFKGLDFYLKDNSCEDFNLNDRVTIISKKYYSNEAYTIATPHKLRLFDLNNNYYTISEDSSFEDENYYGLDQHEGESDNENQIYGPKDLGLWMKTEDGRVMTTYDAETDREIYEFRSDRQYFELYDATPKNLELYILIDLCEDESFIENEIYWYRQYDGYGEISGYEIASPVVFGLYEYDDETKNYVLSSDTWFDINKTYYLDYAGREEATPSNLLLYSYAGEYDPQTMDDPIFVLSQDEEFKADYYTSDIRFYYIYFNNAYEIATPYKCNLEWNPYWVAYKVYTYLDETTYEESEDDNPFDLSTDYKTTTFWRDGQATPGEYNLCIEIENEEIYEEDIDGEASREFNYPTYYKMKVESPLTLQTVYEKIGNQYVISEDETFIEGKTYYMYDWAEVSPVDLGLYEKNSSNQYVLSGDEDFYFGKTYYIKDYNTYIEANPQNLNLYDDLGMTKTEDVSFNPFANAVYFSLKSILNKTSSSVILDNPVILSNDYNKELKITNLPTQNSPSGNYLLSIQNGYSRYVKKVSLQVSDIEPIGSENKGFISNVSQTATGKLEMEKKALDVVNILNYNNHILTVSKNFNREERYNVIDYKKFYHHNITMYWLWVRNTSFGGGTGARIVNKLYFSFEIINNRKEKFTKSDFFTIYNGKKLNCILCHSITADYIVVNRSPIIDSLSATVTYKEGEPALVVHFLKLYMPGATTDNNAYNSPTIDYTLYWTGGGTIRDADGGTSSIFELQDSDFSDKVSDATSVTTY